MLEGNSTIGISIEVQQLVHGGRVSCVRMLPPFRYIQILEGFWSSDGCTQDVEDVVDVLFFGILPETRDGVKLKTSERYSHMIFKFIRARA